ncbi:MAG: hypothetical protein ACREDU_07925 [Methylocella sp.]
MTHPLTGKWRIVEMELWDRAFINLVGPGFIVFDDQGGGEFAFGAVTGVLDCAYAKTSIHFTWEGNDEMDEASGDGSAELQDDGSLNGEISFHHGDESSFIATNWTSSTTC